VGYIFGRQHYDLLVYIPCCDGFASGDMPIHAHECVSDIPRSGGDAPGDAETEEVEEADGERDGDGRANKGAWVRVSLVSSAGEIEERRARGD